MSTVIIQVILECFTGMLAYSDQRTANNLVSYAGFNRCFSDDHFVYCIAKNFAG